MLGFLGPALLSDTWAPKAHFDAFPKDVPIVVFHGRNDTKFSVEFARKFFREDLPEPKHLIERADKHHVWDFSSEDIASILNYLPNSQVRAVAQ